MKRIVLFIVLLDITALLMTAGWIIFSVKGTSYIELFYNYVNAVVVLSSQILNIIELSRK